MGENVGSCRNKGLSNEYLSKNVMHMYMHDLLYINKMALSNAIFLYHILKCQNTNFTGEPESFLNFMALKLIVRITFDV